MTKTQQRKQELQALLGCEPDKLRPCFVSAWHTPPEHLASRAKLRHELLRFVGLEVLTIASRTVKPRAVLQAWAQERGIDKSQVDALLTWAKHNDYRGKGCNQSPYPKSCCAGKASCDWYKRAPWKATDRRGKDYDTFYARGWPKVLGTDAVRMYHALCTFEETRNLQPGLQLFLTRRDARELTGNMRETKQRRGLEQLQEVGLVRVLSWGEPRRAEVPGKPRTVARVVPIPYVE